MVHKKKYEKRKKVTPAPANDNRKPSKLSSNDLVVYSFEIETRHGFEEFCKRIKKVPDLSRFFTSLFGEKFQWQEVSKDSAGNVVLNCAVSCTPVKRDTECYVTAVYLVTYNEQILLGGVTDDEAHHIAQQAQDDAMEFFYTAILSILHANDLL
ncbi:MULTISPECIES: hypothetical protein [unclassified Sulfitobacter]|uniref:hypothetical protein n=1 Tax=unclassified Sulfitobacter TaxID=196795 RepID=UPI003747684A